MVILAKHGYTAAALNRSSMPTDIRAAASELDWEHAHALLTDYLDWLTVADGIDALQRQPLLRHELANLPAPYGPPRGLLLLAYRDSLPVGLVGVQT
jgi:hypothetical protein